MAKELPYFKFEPAEWLTGRISLESFQVQGAFLNLCCLYWQRLGDVKIKEAQLRLKANYQKLVTSEMIVEVGEKISIKFLDTQLDERLEISKKASIAGKKSAAKRAANAQQGFNDRSTTVQQNRIEENRREENNNFLRQNSEWRNKLLKHFNIELEEYLRHLEAFELSNDVNREESELKKHFYNWIKNRDLKKKPRKIVKGFKDIPEKYLPNK